MAKTKSREKIFFIKDLLERLFAVSKRFRCIFKTTTKLYHSPLQKSTENDIIKKEFYAKKRASDPENKILCSACGRSLAIIRKTGIAGCPECYSTFSQEIHEMLRNFGVQQNYTGMLPRRLASFRNTLTDRMDIQLKLEESVRNEDYEKAAVYRDFLHALEKGSVADASDSCQTSEGL